MFAYGRETVSAQCLEPFVDARETVSGPCLPSTAAIDGGRSETVSPRSHPTQPRRAKMRPPRGRAASPPAWTLSDCV
jgi:hypothetical protein